MKTRVWDEIPNSVIANASVIRTRPGQSLAPRVDGSEVVYLVRSGALTQHLALPAALRQITAVFHPGNVVRTASSPPGFARLMAVSPGDVLRLRWPAFRELLETDRETCRYFSKTTAMQDALQAIHVAALGRFDTQQRVATYLLELAMRRGAPTPSGGLIFEMPLSRADMADYLGLNADTLSRTMSRLRADGLIDHQDRSRAAVRSLEALCALTPAAEAMMSVFG